MGRRWIVPVVVLLVVGCGSPPERELVYNNFPIINGEPDTSPEHMAVVAVTDEYSMCTGAWIGSNVVLTAAHCVSVSDRLMRVGFGNEMDSGMAWLLVTEKRVHPQYSSSPTEVINDVAMLKFSGSVPSGVAPIPNLPSSLKITNADIGTQLTHVGFGRTLANDANSVGTKMTMNNDLRWVCTQPGGCGSPSSYNTICQDQTPSGICSGDSGGPVFIVRNGREYVAGVASYTGEDCSDFGCSAKVDEYDLSFISDWVGGYPGAFCTSATQCDSGYCVDGVCCTSRCGGACQACNLTTDGTCANVPNQTPCLDNDLCDGTEACRDGQCVEGAPLNCANDNDNSCTTDWCDPTQGCIHDPVLDGTPCPNQNSCDGEETCLRGNCAMGTPKDCDDLNPCTTDSCDPASGCRHEVVPDGTGCGGGMCGQAVCTQGVCQPMDSSSCDDHDPCTNDWCDPQQGCMHDSLPDGYECGECYLCLGGECLKVNDCDDAGGCGCGHLRGELPAWIGLSILAALIFRRRR